MVLSLLTDGQTAKEQRTNVNAAILALMAEQAGLAAETAARDAAISAEGNARLDADHAIDRSLMNLRRPGDSPYEFTAARVGLPESCAPLDPAGAIAYVNGRAFRVTGAAVVARRKPILCDPSRIIELRFRYRRIATPSDPDGDAINCTIEFMDRNYDLVLEQVVDTRSVTSSDGMQEIVVQVRAIGGVDIPGTAIYARFLVETFGTDGVTEIIDLIAEDRTSAIWSEPDSTALTALAGRVTSLEGEVAILHPLAAGSPNGLASLDAFGHVPQSQLVAGGVFQTRTQAIGANIPDEVVSLLTFAREAAGDGGLAIYKQSDTLLEGGFTSANSKHFALNVIAVRPQMLTGCHADGSTDDLAVLLSAMTCAAALGVGITLNKPHFVSDNITFTVPVHFEFGGRLKMANSKTVSFSRGFSTQQDEQFILDFSAGASNILGRVTAKTVNPYMFGGVGNSPSTDEHDACVAAWNAMCASGLPFDITPTDWSIHRNMTFDMGQVAEYVGTTMYGQGVRSRFNFVAGLTDAANLKITNLTGTFLPSTSPYGQYATFYGWHHDFAVAAHADGVPALQYGERALQGDGDTFVYFNGQVLDNIVVSNGGSGSVGTSIYGFTDSHVNLTSNAGLWGYDGSVALELGSCAFTTFKGSSGHAETGIFLREGALYNLEFQTYDLEVVKIGFKCRSIGAGNILYRGVFANMDYCIDVTTASGAGNIVFDNNQFGGISQGYIRNATATDGSFGGYGCSIRSPNWPLVGYRKPDAGNDSVTSLTLGTFYRNNYWQAAFVHLYMDTAGNQIQKRQWYDTSSAGNRVKNNAAYNETVFLQAGESLQVTGAGACNAYWEGCV